MGRPNCVQWHGLEELRLQINDRDWHPSTGILAPLNPARPGRRQKGDNATNFLCPAECVRTAVPAARTRPCHWGLPAAAYATFHREKKSIRSTLFTRMLSFASCCAIDLARLISAAFTAL